MSLSKRLREYCAMSDSNMLHYNSSICDIFLQYLSMWRINILRSTLDQYLDELSCGLISWVGLGSWS